MLKSMRKKIGKKDEEVVRIVSDDEMRKARKKRESKKVKVRKEGKSKKCGKWRGDIGRDT